MGSATFRQFARRMLRQRSLVLFSLVFAALSAGGLGVGLLGLYPVLKIILPERDGTPGKNLPELVRGLNEQAVASLGQWAHIPEGWISALPNDPFKTVLCVLLGLGFLTLLGAAANFLHQYCALTVVSRTVAGIRRDAFRCAVHLPLKTVLVWGPSDVVSRIVYDTATLAAGLNALLSKAVAQITKGLASLCVAIYWNWKLALIALFIAPALATVIRKLGKRIRRASRSALASQAGLYHNTNEVMTGLRVVKVHASERIESGRFHAINKNVISQELKVRTARALASPLIEVLTLFVLGALALIACHAILKGQLDRNDFLMVFGSLGVAAASLKPLTSLMNDIQQSSAAADRLDELLSLEAEPGHDPKLPELSRHTDSIAFDAVAFTYPGAAQPALRGVNLRIRAGETVAFVGPNGCGKTTLLSLIPRLFDPGAGSVLIDGRDIRSVSVRSLRRQIGVVTQETVLFRGTIGWNIAYGAEGVSPEKVRDAARRARAEDFILAKSAADGAGSGYDFEIGEQGAGLSGGQKQRLAIARAILRDPAILILDEATSMIDAESEAKIAEAIAEFVSGADPPAVSTCQSKGGSVNGTRQTHDSAARTTGRTCLIVAHRLSTVVAADRIVVMDGGSIVDIGRHEELLGRCELYRSLAATQLIRPAPEAAPVS